MTTQVPLPTGYAWRVGSPLDRALLVKFMRRTYSELQTLEGDRHLVATVDQYLAPDTPLWWIVQPEAGARSLSAPTQTYASPLACLWLGKAMDPSTGDRHTHILLLYVAPTHRRQGLGTALLQQAEVLARARGDRQLDLQVFANNTPALQLYQRAGFQTQSLWLTKRL